MGIELANSGLACQPRSAHVHSMSLVVALERLTAARHAGRWLSCTRERQSERVPSLAKSYGRARRSAGRRPVCSGKGTDVGAPTRNRTTT